MRARTFQLIVIGLVLLPIGGCITGTDPVTGEKTRSLDPNSPIVKGAETAAQGVAALGPLFGATGTLIAGIAAGAYGAWKKVKPSLVTAKTQAQHYYAATAATVAGIEEFKELQPEAWSVLGEKISEQLTQQGIDAKVVENVIRGIRGLAPKA